MPKLDVYIPGPSLWRYLYVCTSLKKDVMKVCFKGINNLGGVILSSSHILTAAHPFLQFDRSRSGACLWVKLVYWETGLQLRRAVKLVHIKLRTQSRPFTVEPYLKLFFKHDFKLTCGIFKYALELSLFEFLTRCVWLCKYSNQQEMAPKSWSGMNLLACKRQKEVRHCI